ncbi:MULTISPECIES: hypothetical protein [Streptomyces]|uniref:Glutamine amidotransferase type-2 domain-containing protein n=1 Tax=Streptomyces virginiae TaxID=1961 RepID=A0ABZ1TKI2_STRVG|nr:hypothetical protein [Streptomyces virginiae]
MSHNGEAYAADIERMVADDVYRISEQTLSSAAAFRSSAATVSTCSISRTGSPRRPPSEAKRA